MKRHIWHGIKMVLVLIFIGFAVWAIKLDCVKQACGQVQYPSIGLSNQAVKGDHVDSTSEDFVFNDAFRITSATDDSMFMTKKYIDDAAGGLVDQSVKGDHVDSTDEDFVFNDAFRITSAQAESIFITKNHVEKTISGTLWVHLDDTSAVLWGAINDSTWYALGAAGDTLWAHLDESTAVLWTAIHDTMWANLDESTAVLWTAITDTCWLVRQNMSDTARTAVGDSASLFLRLAGGTMTGNIIMPDDAWIGVSVDSVRIVFDTTAKDLIKVSNGKLRIIDNNACLEFEDDSENEGRIKVGNSQMAIEIDPEDLIVSSDICIKIDGNEVARFHQSTNFGIGTLSPSERLSVEGNAIITGRITSGDTLTKSFVIASPDDTFDFPFWQTKRAITIVAISAVCTGGTNVVGALQEYNATGTAVDAAVDGDWTITTSEYTDASFTNAGIDAGDWLGWKTTSVSGSVTFFSITFEYTEQ